MPFDASLGRYSGMLTFVTSETPTKAASKAAPTRLSSPKDEGLLRTLSVREQVRLKKALRTAPIFDPRTGTTRT